MAGAPGALGVPGAPGAGAPGAGAAAEPDADFLPAEALDFAADGAEAPDDAAGAAVVAPPEGAAVARRGYCARVGRFRLNGAV